MLHSQILTWQLQLLRSQLPGLLRAIVYHYEAFLRCRIASSVVISLAFRVNSDHFRVTHRVYDQGLTDDTANIACAVAICHDLDHLAIAAESCYRRGGPQTALVFEEGLFA